MRVIRTAIFITNFPHFKTGLGGVELNACSWSHTSELGVGGERPNCGSSDFRSCTLFQACVLFVLFCYFVPIGLPATASVLRKCLAKAARLSFFHQSWVLSKTTSHIDSCCWIPAGRAIATQKSCHWFWRDRYFLNTVNNNNKIILR